MMVESICSLYILHLRWYRGKLICEVVYNSVEIFGWADYIEYLWRVVNCKRLNAWEWLLLYGAHGAHWWECVRHLLHSVGVCVWERERQTERGREQCVILWLAEAQELPSGSSHAASVCYVTLLFSHSFPACLCPSLLFLCSHAQRFFFESGWGETVSWCHGWNVSQCSKKRKKPAENDPTCSTFFIFCGPSDCVFCQCKNTCCPLYAATHHHSLFGA